MKCFADAGLKGAKGCAVLTEKQCDNCPFYKTVEQKRIDDMKTLKRLSSLDKVTKMHISEKYNLRLY
jgi:phenylacetate-coenzyme A ligase PaaK-like adenylate-forming protein